MNIKSQVRGLRFGTSVTNMPLVRSNVLCLLLCLQCFFYEGFSIPPQGKSIDLQDDFTNEISDWKCDSNVDCRAVNSSCINNACLCPAGYTYNSDATSCLKVATAFGDSCEETIQCSRYLLNGATCINNKCLCAKGYYYIHGKCNAYSGLFEQCQKDDDCYVNSDFEATSCDNGVCKCSAGFYQREYRTCRPKATAVSQKCLIDKDCTFSSSAYCDEDFTCADDTAFNSSSKFSYNDDTPKETDPVRAESAVDRTCETDDDCKSTKNAVCGPSKTCTCKRAHFFNPEFGKCVPELGEPCSDGDDPMIDYSECRHGKWGCQFGRVVSSTNKKCQKVTKKIHYSCRLDEQCYLFGPDSVCRSNKCTCNEKSWFVESEQFCWTKRGFGKTCQKDLDCHVDGINAVLSCTDNICSCPNGTRLNSNRTKCIETSAELGMECEESSNCATRHSICSNGVCICKRNHLEAGGVCLGGIDSLCYDNSDCAVHKSECFLGHCVCENNYIAASTNSCVPMAHFGKHCENDLQCSLTLPNAVCTASRYNIKTCECAKGYHYYFGTCLKTKALGMSCFTRSECYVNPDVGQVTCRNGRCMCDWGYIQLNDTMCIVDWNYHHYHPNNSNTIKLALGGLLPILLLLINFIKFM